MENEKSVSILVIVLAIVLIVGGGYLLFSSSKAQDNTYTHIGPGGEYNLETQLISGLTFHILTAQVIYDGQTHKEFKLPMRNDPKSVETIPVQDGVTEKILSYRDSDSKLYLTVDPGVDQKLVIAAFELSGVLGSGSQGVFKIPVRGAISASESTNETAVPLITCEDANETVGVIYFRESETNQVVLDNGCVMIEGNTPDNVIATTDKLIYSLLGVI